MIKKILQYLKRTLSKPEGIKLADFGPVSRYFGIDRGTPIDRYYIEKFIAEKKEHIKGNVLEIGESRYSKIYNSGITSIQILHVTSDNPKATIIGDLSNPETLPENVIDCFICTQTYNYIYNVRDAIVGTHKMLAPGGVIIATVAGICQISKYDMNRWGDYWRFTTLSIKKLFEEVFEKSNVFVDFYGNCLTATSFLRGISSEEINLNQLDKKDSDYPVTITIFATKAGKQ